MVTYDYDGILTVRCRSCGLDQRGDLAGDNSVEFAMIRY